MPLKVLYFVAFVVQKLCIEEVFRRLDWPLGRPVSFALAILLSFAEVRLAEARTAKGMSTEPQPAPRAVGSVTDG